MKRTLTVIATITLITLSLTGCELPSQNQTPGKDQIDKTRDIVKELEEGNGVLSDPTIIDTDG